MLLSYPEIVALTVAIHPCRLTSLFIPAAAPYSSFQINGASRGTTDSSPGFGNITSDTNLIHLLQLHLHPR